MWLSPRGSNGRTVTAAFALLAAGPEYMMRAESEVSLAGKQPRISVLRPHHPHAQTEETPVSDLRLGVIGLGLRRSIATSAHHPGQGSAITAGYRAEADIAYRLPEAKGSHGGGDSRIMEEFCRFVRDGGVTDTSPVAARMSVAAGVLATRSLREGGAPFEVPALDPELIAYFEGGQVR
ncbi:hypothetical protein SAMN02787144_100893 [Streptomyces atratus]|uniref:Gfo/Idh/MocA-like oxidoreductase C-terminal domain-containing protein n=1 Tax=Streptomyces atratus TaxID=1893 RepID=A0A1K2B862_STRAR|nr:hypothetical protein SAMN02787144_100893 [Streptomyces atratus]